MPQTTIAIRTDDGSCPAHVFQPAGDGPWPGVLFFMDGIGIRPALFAIGARIAAAGYYVLLPDLFYRVGPYVAPDPKRLFTDEAVRAEWRQRFLSTTNVGNTMRDTRAFLAHLDAQPSVRGPKLGATGYCMGGRMALCAAGHFPDRFAAVAAYHPGNLADDTPESPHLLAPRIAARVYVGAASDDASFPDEQKRRLDEALTAAGVEHVLETYPARHGFVPADTPVHDPAAAERHDRTLLDLLERTLKP
jgi:carboxymethylenebutenolidase